MKIKKLHETYIRESDDDDDDLDDELDDDYEDLYDDDDDPTPAPKLAHPYYPKRPADSVFKVEPESMNISGYPIWTPDINRYLIDVLDVGWLVDTYHDYCYGRDDTPRSVLSHASTSDIIQQGNYVPKAGSSMVSKNFVTAVTRFLELTSPKLPNLYWKDWGLAKSTDKETYLNYRYFLVKALGNVWYSYMYFGCMMAKLASVLQQKLKGQYMIDSEKKPGEKIDVVNNIYLNDFYRTKDNRILAQIVCELDNYKAIASGSDKWCQVTAYFNISYKPDYETLVNLGPDHMSSAANVAAASSSITIELKVKYEYGGDAVDWTTGIPKSTIPGNYLAASSALAKKLYDLINIDARAFHKYVTTELD